MLSNDGIMLKKYYEGTSKIINEATEIGRLLGIVDAANLRKPTTELRKKNKVKTIRSSLAIEGNTLSEGQITDIINNKIVIGPAKEVLEVKNAIEVYDSLETYDPFSEASYLSAHASLMKGLDEPGKYRTQPVGIFKGEQLAHMGPPAWNVHHLMSELFGYLQHGADNLIIKSCVFHYEMEFIHPFMDGNGRMGRLWQTVILMKHNPVFQFLPVETEIRNSQSEYYKVLSVSDKTGVSTAFIEYMLEKIKVSLTVLIDSQRVSHDATDRIAYFIEHIEMDEFSRKDYLKAFKHISTATATRDLKKGVEAGRLLRVGTDRNSRYRVVK